MLSEQNSKLLRERNGRRVQLGWKNESKSGQSPDLNPPGLGTVHHNRNSSECAEVVLDNSHELKHSGRREVRDKLGLRLRTLSRSIRVCIWVKAVSGACLRGSYPAARPP